MNKPKPHHTTTIHKVEIKVGPHGDPGRVARKVMQILKETARGETNQCCRCDEWYEYATPRKGFICWGCANGS